MDRGEIAQNEFDALTFIWAVAQSLAFSFLADKKAPLEKLRPEHLPQPDALSRAYEALVLVMVRGLKDQFQSDGQLQSAVGASVEDLGTRLVHVGALDDVEFQERLATALSGGKEPSVDSLLALFREELTDSIDGLPLSRGNLRASGYTGVVVFYQVIMAHVMRHNLNLLRAKLNLPTDE